MATALERGDEVNPGSVTVVHVAPTPFFADRGCHMRIGGIVAGLQRRGLKNVVCTYHHGRDVAGVDTRRSRPIAKYTKLEAGHSPYKYLADLYLLGKVWEVIRKERPDVIHGHLHEGALIGWMARVLFFWRRLPLVFDVQGSLVGELSAHKHLRGKSLKRRTFWLIEYLVDRLPQHFICSSQASRDSLVDDFGVSHRRITIVNDGADVIEPCGNSALPSREQLGISSGRTVIVYSGALLAAKGLLELQTIIAMVAQQNLPVHFLVIGYPEDPLHQYLAQEELQSWVTALGQVPFEELFGYLALADIAIEPKMSGSGEASGKLLNYMAAGLPVVCFDHANNRRLLGDDGYYATEGHIESVVDQIQAILDDRATALHRGSEGQARVKKEYSWDGAAEKIIRIYSDCLEGSGRDNVLGRSAK